MRRRLLTNLESKSTHSAVLENFNNDSEIIRSLFSFSLEEQNVLRSLDSYQVLENIKTHINENGITKDTKFVLEQIGLSSIAGTAFSNRSN